MLVIHTDAKRRPARLIAHDPEDQKTGLEHLLDALRAGPPVPPPYSTYPPYATASDLQAERERVATVILALEAERKRWLVAGAGLLIAQLHADDVRSREEAAARSGR